MLNWQGKGNCIELLAAIGQAGYSPDVENIVDGYTYDEVVIQQLIDNFEMPMPDISRVKFLKLMGVVGLRPLIKEAFNIFEQTNPNNELYQSASSQYDGGLTFFWKDCLEMYYAFYPLFTQIYADKYGTENPFTLDEPALRAAWWIASTS